MARVAAGDRDAFAALIERHREYVHKLAYRFVGRWDVADDLTQDAFLRVYRAAATYEPTAAFSTWLYRLVLNLCRDWRKGQSYRKHAPLSDGLPGPDGGADAVERQELAVEVAKAHWKYSLSPSQARPKKPARGTSARATSACSP